jgi:hypothetical protein
MKWVSEPNVKLPPKSVPVAAEFEGAWEARVPAPGGAETRLRMTLTNRQGSATGSLTTVAPGSPDLTLSAILQQGLEISFELKANLARYTGQLKDGCLVGEWSQDGHAVPLTWKRVTAETK